MGNGSKVIAHVILQMGKVEEEIKFHIAILFFW